MDLRTFLHTAEALVAELEGDLPENSAYAVRELLRHGEEGMAIDRLVRILVQREIPVTPAQRHTLYELVSYFPPPDGGWSRHVPYLITAAIDWLTVVEDR